MDTKWIQKRAKKSNFFLSPSIDTIYHNKTCMLKNSFNSILKNGYKMDTKRSKKEQKRARLKNQKKNMVLNNLNDNSVENISQKMSKKSSKNVKKSGFKRTTSLNNADDDQTIFSCEICNFATDHKYNYQRHLKTKKHKNMLKQQNNINFQISNTNNGNESHTQVSQNSCICGKTYKYQSGLYKHIKKCKMYISQKNLENDSRYNSNVNNDQEYFKKCLEKITDENFLTNLIKDKINIQQNIINNTQNNHFNVHFFLNETCKNAMNLSDFMNTIETCQKNWNLLLNGNNINMYESFSNMVIHELNEMDVTKRPIHCMDKKRKIVYIKDNNLWEKDDNCEKLSNAVQDISVKAEEITNDVIKDWREKNPEWEKNNEKSDILYNATKNQMNFTNQTKGNKLVNRIINTTMIDKDIQVDKDIQLGDIVDPKDRIENIIIDNKSKI